MDSSIYSRRKYSSADGHPTRTPHTHTRFNVSSIMSVILVYFHGEDLCGWVGVFLGWIGQAAPAIGGAPSLWGPAREKAGGF